MGKNLSTGEGKTMNALEDIQAIRYDLDRYQHIIDVVKSRDNDPDHGIQPLLDDTEIRYVMKQLADARGTIAYYRKRNSDPSIEEIESLRKKLQQIFDITIS